MNSTSSHDDLTKLIDSLREDAAKNIERLLAEKLQELEVFKEEAIRNAEKIVADKIREFEEDSDSFKNQSQYRWDETGLWVSAPSPPPILVPGNASPAHPVPPPPPPAPKKATESASSPSLSYGVRRTSFETGGSIPENPKTIISVAMPPLKDISTVDKDQIRTRPISLKSQHREKRKANRNRGGYVLLLALEFALGFGICYWWWSQWYENQPFIELRPNARGVFVSPESLRRFYGDIRSNHTFGKTENEWKSYEANFQKIGSKVETKFSDDKNSIMVRVDDWVVNVKFENGKITEKALLLFFEDKISVFKNDGYDNRLRIYLVDSVRFDGNPGIANASPSLPLLAEPSTEFGQPLSKIRPEIAQVGSGRAYARTLSSFHRTFENSLNAHAPSKYVFPLNRQWKTLKTHYGLKNLTNLNEANCVFIVKGDARELFRSGEIRDHKEHFLELNVSGVEKLELIVDSNGPHQHDQAVWFAPILVR